MLVHAGRTLRKHAVQGRCVLVAYGSGALQLAFTLLLWGMWLWFYAFTLFAYLGYTLLELVVYAGWMFSYHVVLFWCDRLLPHCVRGVFDADQRRARRHAARGGRNHTPGRPHEMK